MKNTKPTNGRSMSWAESIKGNAGELLEHLRAFFDAESAAECGPSERPIAEVILDGTLFMVNTQMDLQARNFELTALCPKGAEPLLHHALPLSPKKVAYLIEAARSLAIYAGGLDEILADKKPEESEAAQ